MHDLENEAAALLAAIRAAEDKLAIVSLTKERAELQAVSQEPDFWDNSQAAQATMQRIARLDSRINPWQQIHDQMQEVVDLLAMADDAMEEELRQSYTTVKQQFEILKEQLKLNGPYDNFDALLSIFAGAGGTDAQDWTQLLLRMYTRFAEQNGWKLDILDESPGEEAGIKSVTMSLTGSFVYGKLKGEHGVHRLVRLSPFNSDNLRQTSFAKVEIMPKIDQPDQLLIDDKDLKIDVFRSGGHGGQSVNTTDSAVRITHLPTNIVVVIQNERSQLQNRETAMTILRSKLAQLQLEQHADKLEKLRGPNQSAEWGNQIRSYVLHPYKQVKDLRTRFESSDPEAVLDGALEPFIDSYLEYSLSATEELPRRA